jgi:hypothetical protein
MQVYARHLKHVNLTSFVEKEGAMNALAVATCKAYYNPFQSSSLAISLNLLDLFQHFIDDQSLCVDYVPSVQRSNCLCFLVRTSTDQGWRPRTPER